MSDQTWTVPAFHIHFFGLILCPTGLYRKLASVTEGFPQAICENKYLLSCPLPSGLTVQHRVR